MISNTMNFLCAAIYKRFALRPRRAALETQKADGSGEMERKMIILVAAQRMGRFPEDRIYLPVQAGAALAEPVEGLCPDSAGENISGKNRNYCELTAVYWAWKNLEGDAVGLNHYRRYFGGRRRWGDKWDRIAGEREIAAALEKAPVVLPKKRNYFIETNYSQYVHAHHEQDLALTREILAALHPEALPVYDEVMGRTWGHRFNMFVMERPWLERYCAWLFPLLFRLEERLDISGYSDYDRRVFGFVAERLMDVWVESEGVPYTELPVVFTGKQNWWKKGTAFLRRKFFPDKKD